MTVGAGGGVEGGGFGLGGVSVPVVPGLGPPAGPGGPGLERWLAQLAPSETTRAAIHARRNFMDVPPETDSCTGRAGVELARLTVGRPIR